MIENYFKVGFDLLYNHHPDGKRGFYCKSSQKKRRKMKKRVGKGR